jgi:hypothetical protein
MLGTQRKIPELYTTDPASNFKADSRRKVSAF